MMTFGKYVAVDVVSLSGHGSVSTARPVVGGPAVYAVKRYLSAQSDPDEPHWDCQQFLDRARVQKSVVASGARYWVAVHDMGLLPDGAWVVADYHPLSAQRLIDAKTNLSAAALHNLINSAVKGLVELRQVRRRAHGGLKPSNVLIAGGGPLDQARVLLTDPAQGISEGEKGDVFALGNLIHQLVLHRPFAGAQAWPVQPSEEWDRLGRAGARWRELCSAMLAPRPESRPGLFELAALLRELAPRIKTKRVLRKRHLLAPAAAACLVLAAALVLATFVSSARKQLARAKAGWIDALSSDIADPARRARFEADPDLKRALDDFQRSGLATARTDGGGWWNVNPFELHRLRQALAGVRRVQQDLSTDHWRRLNELAALQRQYDERGWDQPADYLAQLIEQTQPRAGAEIADGVDHLFRVLPILKEGRQRVEQKWLRLDENARLLEATHRPTPESFAKALRISAGRALRLSDTGFDGEAEMESNAALAGRVAEIIRPGRPGNIDVARLDEDLATVTDLSHPRPQDIELWLARVPLYRIRTTEISVAAAALQKRLQEAAESVGQIVHPDQRAAFDRDRREAEAQIEQFARTPFIEKEMEAGTFATRRGQLEARVDALRKYSQVQTPGDWLQALPSIATASQRINAYWDAWKQAQLAAARKALENRAQLATLKVRAERMRTTLTDVDRQFPPVPADLPAEFRAAAQKHRDNQIARLISGINPDSPRLDPLAVAGAASSFEDWCASLKSAVKESPLNKEFLAPDLAADPKWSDKQALLGDPDVRELLKPGIDRLARLQSLSEASRADLVRTASESDTPEVAFAAWRHLGRDGLQPAWPSNAQELSTEGELRRKLGGMIASLHDMAERKTPMELLRAQGPVRWRRVVEAASSESALRAAWEARGGFDIDAKQLALLSAPARYNLWLWRAHQEAEGGDEAALSVAIAQLKEAAGQLADRPAATKALSALASAGPKGPIGDQKPGDFFRIALAGVQPPVEFKRVEPQRGRPFYLCTTEISVGQFVAVMDAAGAWEQCRQLPWAYQPGSRDMRRGPRTWEWTDPPLPKLAPPQLWLADEQENDFALPLRAERFNRMVLSDAAGGMPSDQHPMQYVSAQTALWFAGLCGCRLPTTTEWMAAYEKYEKKGPATDWNLRDRAWEVQKAYASVAKSARSPAQWPDEGIFRPDGQTAPSGREARARPTDDGALFFRPVGAPGGSIFHHLVGNVAEYACDDSVDFDALPDKRSPEAIRKFARRAGPRLYVIGGSALSPPETPPDVPLPLARSDEGYADVGLRLAFTAPPRNLAESVKWVLEGQSYLWAAAAQTRESRHAGS